MKRKLKANLSKRLNRVLVVDADVFVYQAIMDNMVEVQSADDEWTYHVNGKAVKDAIESRVGEMLAVLRAREVFMCFGSTSNWRKTLLPEYKAHRTQRKPLGYWETIAWCMETWAGKQVPLLEADDIVGVLATHESWKPGMERIIVSEDKDLDTVPGAHYNPRRPEEGIYEVSVEAARHAHLMQTLTGDPSDGYKGCPGAGEVKAKQILAAAPGLYSEKWKAVVAAFEKADLTERDALVQARVAHILTADYCDLETGGVVYWTPPTAVAKKPPAPGVDARRVPTRQNRAGRVA